jgi:hypothetical protein
MSDNLPYSGDSAAEASRYELDRGELIVAWMHQKHH